MRPGGYMLRNSGVRCYCFKTATFVRVRGMCPMSTSVLTARAGWLPMLQNKRISQNSIQCQSANSLGRLGYATKSEFGVGDLDLCEHLSHSFADLVPLMRNLFNFLDLVDLHEPLPHVLVFVVGETPVDQVRHLIVEQQVGDRQPIACQESRFIPTQYLVQLANRSKHLLKEAVSVLGIQGALSEDCAQVHPDGLEQGRPEVAHVPRDILVDGGSLFDRLAPKISDAGVQLAEIAHDSWAFSQDELAVFEHRYFARRVHGPIVFGALLLGHDVDIKQLTEDFGHIDQGLYCSAWLATQCPVESQARHYLSWIICYFTFQPLNRDRHGQEERIQVEGGLLAGDISQKFIIL